MQILYRKELELGRAINTSLTYDDHIDLVTNKFITLHFFFTFVKDRIWIKLQGWKEKIRSSSGKEILIKAVIQDIPTYVMQCFCLPKSLLSTLGSVTSAEAIALRSFL